MTLPEIFMLASMRPAGLDGTGPTDTTMMLMTRVSIPKQGHKSPGDLSGGQLQSTAIARAIRMAQTLAM